jgi:hypothetical protein
MLSIHTVTYWELTIKFTMQKHSLLTPVTCSIKVIKYFVHDMSFKILQADGETTAKINWFVSGTSFV